jgi:hypothetical protein
MYPIQVYLGSMIKVFGMPCVVSEDNVINFKYHNLDVILTINECLGKMWRFDPHGSNVVNLYTFLNEIRYSDEPYGSFILYYHGHGYEVVAKWEPYEEW